MDCANFAEIRQNDRFGRIIGLRYDTRVKAKAKTSPEHARFQNALRSVLQVSKTDLNRMLANEKIANQGKLKRGPKPKHSSASDHVSSDKG
jgi:hypothetical protein